jgi:hypothetical protein
MKSLLRVLALSLIFSTAYVSREAAAIGSCRGTCIVSCGSGATYQYYDITADECCLKATKFPVCPDAEFAEWYPGNQAACRGLDAFIGCH